MWNAKSVVQEFAQNITLTDTCYGAWMCANVGTGDVSVYGFTLKPGEGNDSWSKLPPEVKWTEPIPIQILTAGGKVRIQRMLFRQALPDEVNGIKGTQISAGKRKGI